MNNIFECSRIDGIIIWEQIDTKYSNHSKIIQKKFSYRINTKFQESIISRFSKESKINYINKSLAICLNQPNKKLLVLPVKYNHYLIDFFYICDCSENQRLNINAYQEDVVEIFKYLFPERSLITANVDAGINDILQAGNKYIDGIIILNISASSNSKYSQYFKIEKQIFKDDIADIAGVVKRINNKSLWNRLDISSKIYLEMHFFHHTTIETWNFYLVDLDGVQYMIIMWSNTPKERFNRGQYKIVCQYRRYQYIEILENLFSLA